MDDKDLQAYLHGELTGEEHLVVEECLQHDTDILERYRHIEEQDRTIIQYVHALQDTPAVDVHEALQQFNQAQSPRPSWLTWLGSLHMSFAMTAATCAALVFFVQRPPWPSNTHQHKTSNTPNKPSMREKSSPPSSLVERQAILQLGFVKQGEKTLRRIGHGDTCQNRDALGFAFHLATPGYPYLFLLDTKKALRIFPFSLQKQRLWNQGHRQITREGVLQLYQLKHHHGTIRLVLLKTQTPLTSEKVTQLQQTLTMKGRVGSSFARHNSDYVDLQVRKIPSRGHP